MKYVFSKKISSHNIAHLYEHIYFIYLDGYLRELGLFPILDYVLNASTTDGEVKFSLELFNSDIKVDNPRLLEIDFSHEITELALYQIESEYKKKYNVSSVEKLKRVLQSINDASWDNGSEIVVDDVLEFDESLDVEILKIETDLGKIEANLRPIYRRLSGIIIDMLISDLADTFGGFVESDTYQVSGDMLQGVVGFSNRVPKDQDIQKNINEVINEFKNNGAVDRLSRESGDLGATKNDIKQGLVVLAQSLDYGIFTQNR